MYLSEREAAKKVGQRLSIGEAFLAQRDLVLVEDRFGNKQTLGEVMDDLGDLRSVDSLVRSGDGLMMRNLHEWFANLEETTRMTHVGSWDKFAYPMVTIVYPNLVAHTLFSVQPMDGPTSLIFYMQAQYGNSKSPTVAGDNMITTPNANYSGEHVESETIQTGNGGAGPYTGSFAWVPLRPSTITITDGTQSAVDDGSGGLAGAGGTTGTIDYATGAFSITFGGVVALGLAITATYDMDLEGNPLVPEIDIALVSSPCTARPRKLRARWSMEGSYNLKKLHGMDAELELVASCTNELKFEIDQTLIGAVNTGTTAVEPVWSSTPATSVSYAEHQLSFVKTWVQAGNRIFQNSGRAVGEWVVGGIGVSNIVEVLPGWDGSGKLTGRGIYEAGVLNNSWRFIKNSYFSSNNYLMGYKGENMYSTGFIYAPYLLFYTTPTYMLDDFISRKGFATMFGQKMVDATFFCRGSVS